MDLSQVEDFLELARVLNFSRAAERRNMTQPAFSRRIRALEETIGTALTERTTRTVTLTAAGRAFLPRAEALSRMAQEAQQEALAAAGQAQRSLTIASTHALSYTFVPRWLMQTIGPQTVGTLSLVSDSYQACLTLLNRGEVNFFISHRALKGETDDGAFRTHTIGEDCLIPLCAPDASGQPRWTPDEDAPLLAYTTASGLHALMQGVPGRIQLRSVLAATNMELARSAQGIAWLPGSLAQDALEDGSLVRADPDAGVPMRIVLHRPKHRLSNHCETIWRAITNTDYA